MARQVVAASSQYVQVTNHADIDITGSTLTVSMWLRTTGAAPDGCALGKWDSGGNKRQYLIQVIAGPKIRVGVSNNGTSTFVQDGATNLSLDTWYHVLLYYNNPTLSVYLNGAVDGTNGAIGITIGSQTSDLFFGCISTLTVPAAFFDGQVAEVALYDVALSASEIASLAKGFSPSLIRPQSLRGYWPLIGRTSPEIDIVNGNSGAVTGATVANHPRVFYPGSLNIGIGAAAPPVETAVHRLTEEFIKVPYHADAAVTSARLTEEFLEVPYRDPLVAGPARLTEEFAEVPYHAELTALADGVRLTQQTVEILYLEPEADPVFDDCGHFTGLREWEVRLYDHMDPDTGKRKAFGSDGYDLNRFIQEMSFELQERGGYGVGRCEFMSEWDKVSLAGTERVDVYLWDQPAYRGYLRIAQRNLNSPESASPQFYGMVAILDQWLVKRKYAYGCDTDVATIARDIALDYVQVAGRFPNCSLDMSTTVGATLKEFDGRGKSVAQCFNELADLAPNQVIWGVEMDDGEPVPGDVLYFRPRPTDVAYVVAVGDNVQAMVYPVDTHEIVNSLAPLKGGPVSQPNLCPNGSFEEAAPASEDHGNYLLNASFEDDAGSHPHWTSIGPDPTVKYSGHVTAHGSARTGNQWAELDESGEGFYQDVGIVSGRRYEVSCWARLEDSGLSNSGLMELEAYDSGMALLATTSVGLTSLTGNYQRFVCDLDLASYPTATTLRVIVSSNGGSASNDGVLVDDVGLYEYCSPAQEFWRITPQGAATIDDYDPLYEGVTARTGAYSVHVKADDISTAADAVDLYLPIAHSPSVEPNERYTLIVWWHVGGVGAAGDNALSIGAVNIESDGTQDTDVESDTIVGNPSTWQMAYLEIVTDSDTAKLQLYIRVRTERDIYIDDVMLVQGEVPDEVENYGGYWPADTYERYIDVEDTTEYSSTQDFDDLLDADVADSIDDYGEHEAEMSNDLVTDRQTALAFAAGQFNARALPKVEATLNIYAARELIFNGGKVRIVNLPNAPDALYPARSTYTITPAAILASVELGNTRPDLQSLLQLTAERARR